MKIKTLLMLLIALGLVGGVVGATADPAMAGKPAQGKDK